MPSDWNDEDRYAIRLWGTWIGVMISGKIMLAMILPEHGQPDSQPFAVTLILIALWIGCVIWAAIYTSRLRKRRRH